MEDVICVGTPAINIGLILSSYKNYNVLFVGHSKPKNSKNYYQFKVHQKPEEYEELYDSGIDSFLDKKTKSSNVTFILCGASTLSNAVLRMMQGLKEQKNCEIKVLYIKPEAMLLSETKKLQQRVMFNVLQQYARSGVLKSISIVCNESLSEIVGDVPMLDFYPKINEVIATTFHMVNVFENTKSVTDTFSPPKDTSRINTYCVFSPCSEKTEKSFYNISDMSEAKYYYGIPQVSLKEEKSLYREILQEMKKRVEIYSKVSYGIYETSYDTKIGYGVLYSNKIQEQNNS